MNTTYRKNLKDIATACKNYTDTSIAQAKEEIYWHIGEYSVSTSDDNTTALTKTVPSNATRVKIKRIYGNSVKYAPSTSYDDTSVKDKSIPSNTYTLGLDYVGGYSEKSENLAVFENETITSGGVSFTFLNGVCNSSGTPSGTGWIRFKAITLSAGSYGYADLTSGATKLSLTDANYQAKSSTFTLSETTTLYWSVTGNALNNAQLVNSMPMLIEGSTAPTEFKVGFEGIRDTKTTSVVVRGSNLANNPTITNNVSSDYDSFIILENLNLKANTTYTISFKNTNTLASGTRYYITANPSIAYVYTGANSTKTDYSLTFTTAEITTRVNVRLQYTSGGNTGTTTDVMLNEDNSALPYVPYQTPIQVNIPAEIQALDLCRSAGSINDIIDFNNKKGIQNIRQVVLDETSSWGFTEFNNLHRVNIAISSIYNVGTTRNADYLVCDIFRVNTAGNVMDCFQYEKIVIFYPPSEAITSQQAFLTWVANNPITLNYRLATPIETDISAYLPSGFNNIATNDNYTDVEFVNEYDYDMPNKISFYGTIKETLCTAIEQRRNGELIKTIQLPYETSDGWSAGSIANVRDFTTNERIPNVDKLNDLGDSSLNIVLRTNYDNPIFALAIPNIKQFASAMPSVNLLTPNYKTTNVIGITLFASSASDLSIALRTNSNEILFKDYKFNSVGNLKENLNGKPLYYEKASATPTSLDSIENIIEVEPNDTLTFVNSNNQPVPSDLTYRIEVAN